MEKISQIKSKFFKFLSKQPITSVSFRSPTVSPCRSPTRIVSIIPKEARRKHKGGSFSAKEPTSPKVSCMGQVQSKKNRKAQKRKRVQQPPKKNNNSVRCPEKKILLWISKGSDKGRKQSGKGFVSEEKAQDTLKAPSLDTMKKFTSGRGSLYDFDVTLAER
ncbi:uncharacterized protein At1g76070-like [Gastrolobium bilobum]|uniref:uncharacterized protein At1g76070-like n=1 Tax=Gastrolobium bilobum TaxID=150636 RepID=UPI002AB0E451|nr:uncharacterized protein At1g76070-like [Gastrolobium bilobum]